MKVIEAQTLPDGSRRFVIEVAAATADTPAVTEEYVWGADVPLAAAQREMRALLAARYQRPAPTRIAGLVGRDV